VTDRVSSLLTKLITATESVVTLCFVCVFSYPPHQRRWEVTFAPASVISE